MNDPFEKAVAREKLEHRERRTRHVWRSLVHHAQIYAVVNLALVAIWGLTESGTFWPVWPILGWGIGLYFHWSHYRAHARRDRTLRAEIEEAGPDATGPADPTDRRSWR